jgi:hypothetical protein
MRAAGTSATCLPVRLDGPDWETALFFQLSGPECEADRQALAAATGPVPVGLESDLAETGHGAVVILRAELHARPTDPLGAEILLAPGQGGAHFESLDLLSRQPRLCWFFGDESGRILYSQAHPLDPEHNEAFGALLADAAREDALARIATRYDGAAAIAEVAARYELRTQGADRSPPGARGHH